MKHSASICRQNGYFLRFRCTANKKCCLSTSNVKRARQKNNHCSAPAIVKIAHRPHFEYPSMAARRRKMRDHPIGMDYSRVALQKASRYRYPLMNHRIRLFDGRVGCGSCHSLYSNERKFLVQHNYRGALCRECHDL